MWTKLSKKCLNLMELKTMIATVHEFKLNFLTIKGAFRASSFDGVICAFIGEYLNASNDNFTFLDAYGVCPASRVFAEKSGLPEIVRNGDGLSIMDTVLFLLGGVAI